MEGLKLTGYALGFFMKLYDEHQIKKHLGFLELAMGDLSDAYESGLVPKKFHNSESYSDLLNAIISGTSVYGDKEVEKLGISIYNTYNSKEEKGGNSFWHNIWQREQDKIDQWYSTNDK